MPIERIDETRERFYRFLPDEEPPKVEPITFEIIKNRLDAIANEMGAAVHSMAHSPIFAEIKDFSCSIFDHQARMVGMGYFLPVHQGGLQSHIDGLVATVGLESMKEGDIFMSNDVFYGASHPPDIVLCEPIFYKGEFIGLSANLVHHLDMGGTAPATYWAGATEIYQEGIRFPPTTKLYERGKLREDILNIFLTNVRMPEPQRADLMAQVGGCHTGSRRVGELAEKYGPKVLKDIYTAIQYHAARIVKTLTEEMHDGVYENEEYVEGDGLTDTNFKVKCTMTIKGDHMTLDFSESSKQAAGYINCPWAITSACAYAPVMPMVPQCPKCYGFGVPIELISEKGSIVNPSPTAPIMTCTTEVGQVLYNIVWDCLTQANPVLGSGLWGAASSFQYMWGYDQRFKKNFITIDTNAMVGGGGARRTMDGWPVASQKSSMITMPNIEINEAQFPVIYNYRRLCKEADFPGSGAGTFRGGLGVEFEVRPVDTDLTFSTTSNKFHYPITSFFGARPGHVAKGEIRDAKTDVLKKKLRPKNSQDTLSRDEVLFWASPGGGGYGSPLKRDPEIVREDVIDGFVTIASARKYYGVVLNEKTLKVDYKATEDLRRKFAR